VLELRVSWFKST